jgi:hypothetical protein
VNVLLELISVVREDALGLRECNSIRGEYLPCPGTAAEVARLELLVTLAEHALETLGITDRGRELLEGE